jgi:Sulfotransferase family
MGGTHVHRSAAASAEPPPCADPIFIHGILPRSGTNFLWDLLLLHPDCAPAREPVREDLFLAHSDRLVHFVDEVRAGWNPMWGSFADVPEQLCAHLGDGLLSFLRVDPNRRLVTKSPSVARLQRFFAFFPSARLLILLRDGRSVVHSATRSLAADWDFERACREWATAARTIRDFQQAQSERSSRWRIVRYEEVVEDPERQLRRIFQFLALDADRYDFEAAHRLPVRGSSTFGRQDGKTHWNPVARDETFAPTERWRSWPADQLRRFEWLAGAEQVELGYSVAHRRFSLAETAAHTLRDWRWRSDRWARVIVYRTRGRLALRTRATRLLHAMRARLAAR